MPVRLTRTRSLAVALVLGAATVGTAGGTELDQAVDVRVKAQTEGAQSQGRIDKVADETDLLLTDYRATLQRIEALRVYNDQLQELVRSQEEEETTLKGEIDNVTVVGRQIIPLLLRMIDSLDAFVELDVPFLQNERTTRVENLRDLMVRADVTDAEKFRRVLEAYQVENDYGRTLEAYRAELEFDGQTRQVEFLRIGRTALFYQTLDGTELGMWDKADGEWIPLDARYRIALRQGLRMARKQAAPDLLRLPVGAAEAL